MKNNFKSKLGFTLLELILVLFTLSLSLILAVPYAREANTRYESKVMVRNVMQHFEYVHKMTVVRKGVYFVTFKENTVEFRGDLTKSLPDDKTFVFPEETTFNKINRITITPSGNVGAQTITLITPTKKYAIVFQLTGGRYRVEEK